MLALYLFNLVTTIATLTAILMKLYKSPRRVVIEEFDGHGLDSWLCWQPSYWQPQGMRRKEGYETEDFAFNIFMLLLGLFMVTLGVFYNAGFDLLGVYSDLALNAQVYYPWAFLFLVGGTLVVVVNSMFSFLKMT